MKTYPLVRAQYPYGSQFTQTLARALADLAALAGCAVCDLRLGQDFSHRREYYTLAGKYAGCIYRG